ncbi:hypothetical protein AAVH_08492, partial [Aphelenchoides avenae]
MTRQCNDCGDCGADVIVPKPCDPNHGTASDPKQILCDAVSEGKDVSDLPVPHRLRRWRRLEHANK